MSEYKLKYPVVLVHGIAAKDNSLFWGRIPERLKESGTEVTLGQTDSWGSIENNANSLRKTIDTVLEKYNTNKVNIIAHSKGGLDSRYVISKMEYASKVASLSTISTPHLGSEIADYIFDKKYIHTRYAKKLTYALAKLYGDESPDPHEMLQDITTQNMIRFNQQNLNSESVYYCSYHSAMSNSFDDLSHFFMYKLIAKIAGANDGVVSLKSSKWGEKHTLINGKNGGISHSEIIDIKRKKISGIDIPDEYLKIVGNLISLGF